MADTTFSEALKRGCKIAHAVKIEGIPYIFTQFDDDHVATSAPPTVPAGYTSAVNCLVIEKAGEINVELDRRKGIARGGPLSILLTYEGLKKAGVLDDLFGRPTAEAIITTDITQAATGINATTASDLGASGGAYIGKEYFSFTGSTASAFTGVTRGAVGFKYIHKKDSFTTHRMVTDRPRSWRGRFVTIYEQLCDPTGRPLEAVHATNSTYTREIWRGFIDEQPNPARYGFELNCLTLERRLSQTLGFTQNWERVEPVALFKDMSLAFHFEKDGTSVFSEYVHGQSNLGTGYNPKWIVGGDAGLAAWWLAYHVFLWMTFGDCEADTSNGGPFDLSPSSPINTFSTDQTPYLTMSPPFVNYTMLANEGAGVPWLQSQQGNHTCLFSYKEDSKSDYPLHRFFLTQVAGSTYKDYELPDKGLALVHSDSDTEIVLFEKSTGSENIYEGGTKGDSVDITQRALAQSKPISFWERQSNGNAQSSLTMTIPAGDYGKLASVILTLLQSSGGAGHFGTFDTLGLGLGCAIPSDYINLSTFENEDNILDETAITISDGTSTFDKLLGGWLVLSGSNIVQRRQSDQTIKLEAVKHEVGLWVDSPDVIEITAADVLLSGVNPLKVIESPNVVNIDGKGLGVEAQLPDVIIRDIPRCQQEGPHVLELSAGGCTVEAALNGAKRIIAYGDGQFSIKLPLAPWVDVQAGDRCSLDLLALGHGHPLLFNYEAGTHPNAEKLPARCMGVSRNLVTGSQLGTFLLYGATLPALLLAPTVTVTNVSGSDITLSTADAKLFYSGDYIELYNPGNEDLGTPELASLEITGKTGDVLTLASVPAWVAATTTKGTFPPFANADTVQKNHAYNKEISKYRWY